MATILSRIEEIASKEGITIGAFERNIGASKGVLSRAINNGTDIQAKWLGVIVEKYPQYSADWLLSGQGNMLKNAQNTQTVEKYQYRSDSEIIEIENPPIVPRELTKKPNLDTLELVKNDADELITSRVKIDGLAFSMWVRVGDAALEPHYHPEDKLALIAYPHGQERPIYGKVHGIDTISNGMILRRLYPHPDGYIAKSYAPDEFPDLFIPHDDIIRVYRALVQVRTL